MAELIIQREKRTARYFVERLPGGVGLDMVQVPAGRFVMGSPEDEPERYESEGPQHEVAVSSFCMGRYPVTQAQWRAVAGLPEVGKELEAEPSRFKGDQRPVERVTWYDAVEFCARLSDRTGRGYRLPTEAEWEYACRAGTPTPFYWGRTLTTELANYDGSAYAGGLGGEGRGETTPVNHFGLANAWGLCDMHGNVWEWCQDHWHDSYERAPTDGGAWLTENEESGRVLRGGSWDYSPGYCRSASRFNSSPANRGFDIGFRIVCVAPRTPQ